jgi:oligopeptide/dipeptide ABC transporter ATP-binding protein
MLTLDRLSIHLPGNLPVLEDLSLQIAPGEMLALVGESGSGKTMAALSIPRLLPPGATLSGRITLGDQVLTDLPDAVLRQVRARRIGMVFQDPLAALNPSHTVGAQVAEPIRLNLRLGPRAAWSRAVELLAEMGIADPAARARDYPHQFSGGMRQRVMMAVALACDPALLIADEPTTGLDPALKSQILDLLARLRRDRRLAVLLVSHDLALVRRHADQLHVLYAGRTAERGPATSLFASPRHPYTQALLLAAPVPGVAPQAIAGQMPEPGQRPPGCRFADRCRLADDVCGAAPILQGPISENPIFENGDTQVACWHPPSEMPAPAAVRAPARNQAGAPIVLHVEHVTVRLGGVRFRQSAFEPVCDADLVLREGECLAVVGPSGSGKTSLARAILQMLPYRGGMMLRGANLRGLRGKGLRRARRRIGAVFQDPFASLNPLMTVADIIGEAMYLGGISDRAERRVRASALLEDVGLPQSLLGRTPRTLSGGQAQRVAIARALAAKPDLLVLDEPTSSLDVSSQAIVLTLLQKVQRDRGLALILITHDLAAVSFLAHRALEVRDGQLRELPPLTAWAEAVLF